MTPGTTRGKYARAPVPAAPDGFFTVQDIAGMRNVEEGTVRAWIHSGRLAVTVESGKTPSPRYLIRKEDFRKFQEGRGGMR